MADPTNFPSLSDAARMSNPAKPQHRKSRYQPAENILDKTQEAAERAMSDQLNAATLELTQLREQVKKFQEACKEKDALAEKNAGLEKQVSALVADLDFLTSENKTLRETVVSKDQTIEYLRANEITLQALKAEMEKKHSSEGVHMPNTEKMYDVLQSHKPVMQQFSGLSADMKRVGLAEDINSLRQSAQTYCETKLISEITLEFLEKALAQFESEYNLCKDKYKELKPKVDAVIESLDAETKAASHNPIPEEFVLAFSAINNFKIQTHRENTILFNKQREICKDELTTLKGVLAKVNRRFYDTKNHLHNIFGYNEYRKGKLSWAVYKANMYSSPYLTPIEEMEKEAAEAKIRAQGISSAPSPEAKGSVQVLTVPPVT